MPALYFRGANMEQRIRNILENMNYEDLISMRNDVKKGSFDFNGILNETMSEKEKEHKKFCSVCGQDLDPYCSTSSTIIFGPRDFKKKASFCAIDCLEYFILRIKEMKVKTMKEKIEKKV